MTMVQVVENRTDLGGLVIARAQHPELADFDVLWVDVRSAKSVQGVADLLSSRVGSQIKLNVRRSFLPDRPIERQWIHCRAYMSGPDVIFAEPDPARGTINISSP